MARLLPPKMSLCSAVMRYLFFGFNLMFFLSGLALIGAGGYIQYVYYMYDLNAFIEEVCFVLPLLIILIGFTISFISFFGCVGAAKDSCHRLLYAYGVFIGLLFVMEIATGVVGYVYRAQIEKGFESGMKDLIADYRDGSAAKALMLTIENELGCCGASGPEDYEQRNIELPKRCCLTFDGPEDECPADKLNHLGCAHALKLLLMSFATLLSCVGGLIVLVQLFGIISATVIARAIRRGRAYQTLES